MRILEKYREELKKFLSAVCNSTGERNLVLFLAYATMRTCLH
jgi:hypothetical protein